MGKHPRRQTPKEPAFLRNDRAAAPDAAAPKGKGKGKGKREGANEILVAQNEEEAEPDSDDEAFVASHAKYASFMADRLTVEGAPVGLVSSSNPSRTPPQPAVSSSPPPTVCSSVPRPPLSVAAMARRRPEPPASRRTLPPARRNTYTYCSPRRVFLRTVNLRLVS